nr:PREDICTED: kazrin-like isoform X1 [Bemisia tabaci]
MALGVEKAITVLECLNEEIAATLVADQCLTAEENGPEESSRQDFVLQTSMALMKRLLVDAQNKFRKMVDENRQLGSRIDGEIHQANEEMSAIRDELSHTRKKLDEHLHLTNGSANPAPAQPPPNHPNPNPAPPVPARNRPPAARTDSTPDQDRNGPDAKSERSRTEATSERAGPEVTSVNGTGSGNGEDRTESNGDADSDQSKDAIADSGSSRSTADSLSSSDVSEPALSAPRSESEGAAAAPNFQKHLRDQLQLVRPASPTPGPSSKSDHVGGSNQSNVDIANLSNDAQSSCNASTRLRLENDRLKREVAELRKLISVSGIATGNLCNSIDSSSKSPVDSAKSSIAANEDLNDSEKISALETELSQAKQALAALKSDRKRLKAEKFDLLNQMKQLYGTLGDKEKELREFIRSFEQRMRESEEQLAQERAERERERWSLLRHARDEAERSLSLAAQLDLKEQLLLEARRQLSAAGCLSDQESLASVSLCGGASAKTVNGMSTNVCLVPAAGDRGSCSADSGVRGSSDRESGATSAGGNLSDSTTDGAPTITIEPSTGEFDSISLVSSIAPPSLYQSIINPKDCSSPSLSPLNAHSFSRSLDNNTFSRSVEQLNSPPLESEPVRRNKLLRSSGGRSGVGSTWGSISRVFARSRHRKVSSPSSVHEVVSDVGDSHGRSWSPLTEEGYAEKLRLLREAASVPMERWRAPTVLAWLEIALGMPQYGPRCSENIKSGKVLLELNEIELENGLGITHPMHRKKLVLAIEEHRHPSLVRYPCIGQLGHTWVSSEWLPDLGLAQYSESFAANMVDARMLDHLSKKELEKFLGVTRKFHQASIVHGIHLLRMIKYDRQALAIRRHQCENIDADPLVWTNQRFIRWARSIDLGEYADNLKGSGVHGALVVLESSFNGDTMATALGIPPSRNMIRRHLTAELESLVLPARSLLEMQAMYLQH